MRPATSRAASVSFGTFNSAHLYLLTGLIRDFHARIPR